ncbi:MAG: hypothetical protein ABL993_12880 [Vicinamibacterales bacterium]
MARGTLVERVEQLELTVQGLDTLPAEVAALGERVGSVETQISQLRGEMRMEFSAVRQEMHDLRHEMREGFISITTELGQQIVETASQSRMMFEEALSSNAIIAERLAGLLESRTSRTPRRKR